MGSVLSYRAPDFRHPTEQNIRKYGTFNLAVASALLVIAVVDVSVALTTVGAALMAFWFVALLVVGLLTPNLKRTMGMQTYAPEYYKTLDVILGAMTAFTAAGTATGVAASAMWWKGWDLGDKETCEMDEVAAKMECVPNDDYATQAAGRTFAFISAACELGCVAAAYCLQLAKKPLRDISASPSDRLVSSLDESEDPEAPLVPYKEAAPDTIRVNGVTYVRYDGAAEPPAGGPEHHEQDGTEGDE